MIKFCLYIYYTAPRIKQNPLSSVTDTQRVINLWTFFVRDAK